MKVEKLREDDRGSILLITVGEREFLLLETFDGKMRGGDIHKSSQHDLVLEGKILWRIEDGEFYLSEDESIVTKPQVPHMMQSIGYSVILEWLEKPELEYEDGKFVKHYYEPFRKLMEASE